MNAERAGIGGQSGAGWAAEVAARLASMPNVRGMARTMGTGVYDQGTYGALQRHAPGARLQETFWRIVARRAVLAAGATERPVALAGNDRPGVMMAGVSRASVWRRPSISRVPVILQPSRERLSILPRAATPLMETITSSSVLARLPLRFSIPVPPRIEIPH